MSKIIPEDLELPLVAVLKYKLLSNKAILSMTDEERLSMLAQFEGLSFIKEMLKTKTSVELLQDMEIKSALYSFEEIFKNEISVCEKIIAIFEPAEPATPITENPQPPTNN